MAAKQSKARFESLKFDMYDWTKKRSLTTKAFCVINFALGMEQAMIFVTLWLYIKTLVKPKYPIAFYTLISVIYYVTGIVCSLIVSRFLDRYRRVRTTFLALNFLVLIGNTIYAAPPISGFLPLTGRAFAGAGQAFQPVMVAEIARCYEAVEAIPVFSALALAGAIGFLMGSILNSTLVLVDFAWKSYKVTYANAPGIYMAIVCFALEILIYFAVHDLSRIHSLKDSKDEDENSDDESDMNKDETKPKKIRFLDDDLFNPNLSTAHDEQDSSPLTEPPVNQFSDLSKGELASPLLQDDAEEEWRPEETEPDNVETDPFSIKTVLKKLFSNIDTLIIMGSSLLYSYIIISIKMWLPLLVVETLHWGVEEMNLIMLGAGATSIFMLIFLWLTPVAHSRLYKLSMFSIFVLTMLLAIIILVKIYSNVVAVNIVGWVIFGALYGFVVTLEDVFLVSSLAQMVSSGAQSFAESIRLSFTRTGAVLALSLAGVSFSAIIPLSVGMIVFVQVTFILMILRWRQFIKPTEVVSEKEPEEDIAGLFEIGY